MRQEKQYCVYILTNRYNTALYIGITSDISKRISQHRDKAVVSHTQRYNLHKLVYCEVTPDVYSAIAREKQLKHWTHRKKRTLISLQNPKWKDLSNVL